MSRGRCIPHRIPRLAEKRRGNRRMSRTGPMRAWPGSARGSSKRWSRDFGRNGLRRSGGGRQH
eukprot:9386133-Pyramimonas_sp.AAC.2